MPFLTSHHGRHELTPGTHILGGRDERSVPLSELVDLAAAAITVAPPGPPVIRRLAPNLVKIKGRGCTLRVGSIKLRFGPSVVAPPEGYGTRRVVGLAERPSKLIGE